MKKPVILPKLDSKTMLEKMIDEINKLGMGQSQDKVEIQATYIDSLP